MSRCRRSPVVLALLLAALMAPGCRKARDTGGQVPAPLGHLPADTALVVDIQLERLRASPLRGPLQAAIEGRAGKALEAAGAVCGIDLVADIERIALAVGPSLAAEDSLLLLTGIDRERLDRCIPALASAYADVSLETRQRGPLSTYEQLDSDEPPMHAAWAGPGAVLVAPARLADAEHLERLAAADRLTGTDDLVVQARAARTDALLWGALVALPGTPIEAMLAESGVRPGTGHFSLEWNERVEARVTLGFASAAEAGAAAPILQRAVVQALAGVPIPDLAPDVTVAPEGTEVQLRVSLDPTSRRAIETVLRDLAE